MQGAAEVAQPGQRPGKGGAHLGVKAGVVVAYFCSESIIALSPPLHGLAAP